MSRIRNKKGIKYYEEADKQIDKTTNKTNK